MPPSALFLPAPLLLLWRCLLNFSFLPPWLAVNSAPALPTPDELLAAQLNAFVGVDGGTAASPSNYGGYINMTQGGGTWVWNDLVIASLGVLVIPSKFNLKKPVGAFSGCAFADVRSARAVCVLKKAWRGA